MKRLPIRAMMRHGLLAIAAFGLLVACNHSTTANIKIKSSSTMANLVQSWALQFMADNPNVHVSVVEADSGKSIKDLIEGKINIAAASRALSKDEEDLAKARDIKPQRETVGRDSIAVIVNSDNPITELSLVQLKNIFDGQITNWQQLGGKKEPIHALRREEDSGTYKYFREHVLQNENYGDRDKQYRSSGAITDAVASDKLAVACVGLGNLANAKTKVKVVSVKLLQHSSAVEATKASTTSDYPISRPLFLISSADDDDATKRFIRFCLSQKGQQFVSQAGYVPLRP